MNLQALTIVLMLFGLILAAIGLRGLWRRRFLTASASLFSSAILLSGAALVFVVASNLYTYSRLTYEAPIVDLIFKATGPQRYQATLIHAPSGEMQVFAVSGDEWQLDARVLKWRGWATLLGLDAQYRLERLSGRYLDIEKERNAPRTLYRLSDNPGVDLWAWSIDHPRWVPFVDAVYGSATFLPMADGARYRVTLSQTGLVARPMNSTATTAVDHWPAATPK
jgi:NADH:ubiquinone oxidoreductase subunit K